MALTRGFSHLRVLNIKKQRMKPVAVAVFFFVLVTCFGSESGFSAGNDGVIFTNHAPLDVDIQIGMRRDSNGVVTLEAYSLPYERDSSGKLYRRPHLLRSAKISSETFLQIVYTLESKKLRDISDGYPPAGLDGWTWEFQRVSGKSNLTYSFFTPEWNRDARGIQEVIALGRRFVQAAGLEDLFPRIKPAINEATGH